MYALEVTNHACSSVLRAFQGANLGPYVLDIEKSMQGASYLFYADNLELYREIKDEKDTTLLQNDLDELLERNEENRLPLNGEMQRNNYMSRSRNLFIQTILFGKNILEKVDDLRDLEVQIQNDFHYNKHLQKVIATANRNKGVIMRHSKFLV